MGLLTFMFKKNFFNLCTLHVDAAEEMDSVHATGCLSAIIKYLDVSTDLSRLICVQNA